nr:DUF6809 family protein [uncultured Oscillibacter sp.]
MRSLIETLYFYAQENRVMDYLQIREYRQFSSGLEEEWDNFRTTLTAEQEQRLELLLTRQFEAGCLEDRASFLAGVSVGLELSRL